MLDEIVNKIMAMIIEQIPNESRSVQMALYAVLSQYDFQPKKFELQIQDVSANEKIIKNFLVVKKVEGRTDRTIKYYLGELKKVFTYIDKPIQQVTTNDIRRFMAYQELERKNSAATVNNTRRALSSFYNWAFYEKIVDDNPMAKIKKIKAPKTIKKAFTDMEVEMLRRGARNNRELAILTFCLVQG